MIKVSEHEASLLLSNWAKVSGYKVQIYEILPNKRGFDLMEAVCMAAKNSPLREPFTECLIASVLEVEP